MKPSPCEQLLIGAPAGSPLLNLVHDIGLAVLERQRREAHPGARHVQHRSLAHWVTELRGHQKAFCGVTLVLIAGGHFIPAILKEMDDNILARMGFPSAS